jgi:gas vesicle structural protein
MPLERTAGTSNIVDILDRVLDKGIVIDAWVRVSLVGIELVTVEARVVVASIATYLGYADTLAELKPSSAQTAQVSIPSAARPAAPIFAINGHR